MIRLTPNPQEGVKTGTELFAMMDKSHLAPNAQTGRPRSQTGSNSQDSTFQPMMNPNTETRRAPRKLVLCFDGTGNKFHGDDSDSNILKIFSSLTHTSTAARIRSWYLKMKDSAVGSSFDQHVVGGYRFLMRFYSPGDEIYFFGFSRGAYVARFLAEMLDYVGLLSHGNEEMVVFAWKAFSRWQARRTDNSEEGMAKKREMYRFMIGFRETFSRPVKRIRFLGLFDTVNSVPRFEAAWMQRSKFPYTAKTNAKVIRHCVSIDERRAKFRQDLIYQGAAEKEKKHKRHSYRPQFNVSRGKKTATNGTAATTPNERYRARRTAVSQPSQQQPQNSVADERGRRDTLKLPDTEKTYRPHSRSRSRTTRGSAEAPSTSHVDFEYEDDSEDDCQDIDEIWFAGGHGDVGGGWEYIPGTKSASHVPLAYMIREAQKAGLHFDPEKLVELDCTPPLDDEYPASPPQSSGGQNGDGDGNRAVPGIHIDAASPSPESAEEEEKNMDITDWSHFSQSNVDNEHEKNDHHRLHPFHEMMHHAHVSLIHDSLEFSSGLTHMQVLSWKIMEYMPFRRMDLQSDGSWKPIRWPLPCGEVRDIPHTARVHGSVIRRMKMDPKYRPGNLIVGGGGRGMRHAPEEYGMGEWECVAEEGDPVGEVWVKRTPAPSET
ncbi:short chain dehydrogenase reductase family [Apiospora rasikravindrae]|uniref:Short chain dehydrogenase reductase family n=1 Tax=Apiospora rasikravindrae TaxID=990691 RepID=A0ABR1RWG1_9PEZI